MLKNQIGVIVSIRNLISQASVLQQSLRSSLIVPVVTLGIVSGCSTNPELGDVPDNRLPTVPAELPPPPVPDAIPGLQQGAESAAIGVVNAVPGQDSLQSGLRLKVITTPAHRHRQTEPRSLLSTMTVATSVLLFKI